MSSHQLNKSKKKLIENNNELSKKELNESNDNEFYKESNISNVFFENSYCFISFSINFLYKTIKIIIKISGVYLLWIFLHFVASYLYTKLCVPTTFFGLLMSPFLTATPHCQGLRWIIYNGANVINNMWLIVGTWLCAYVMRLESNNDEM